MRKHNYNYNYRLINALLALHSMQDPGYDYPPAYQEVFERCSRWLDAMVPPKNKEEGSRPTGYLSEEDEQELAAKAE